MACVAVSIFFSMHVWSRGGMDVAIQEDGGNVSTNTKRGLIVSVGRSRVCC